jgi:L-rhamnonate dehydratase
MKITEIRINRLNAPRRELKTKPRRPPWAADAEVANPMSRYPKVKRHRSLWLPKWGGAWVQVFAEDGTWGLGTLNHAPPCIPVVEHLATHLVGEECMAIDKLADMMFRLTKPYGSTGLASYAISALDLALWDLKGKLLGEPVYSLLGGPQKERLFRRAGRPGQERGLCGPGTRDDRRRVRADARLLDGL